MTGLLPKSTLLAAIVCLPLAALTGFLGCVVGHHSSTRLELDGEIYYAAQVEFMGYCGIQILLSDYGRTLNGEP